MKIKVSKLVPNKGQIKDVPQNPRFIKDEKFDLLKKSLEEDPDFTDLNPILVYDNKTEYIVMGGNMRVLAAKELGWKEIEASVMPPETPPDVIRARIIKHNADYGSDDPDILANEWSDYPLEDWGMDTPEWENDTEVEEDEAPEVSSEPPKSKLGEIYQLGRHKIICGSAVSEDDVNNLIGTHGIDLYLTDPPYNVDYTGKTKDALKIENDVMGDDDFLFFLITDHSVKFRQAKQERRASHYETHKYTGLPYSKQ